MSYPRVITRITEIDAAHRLLRHEGRCKNIHGHRYRFEISLTSEMFLPKDGMVLDFSEIDDTIGRWLNYHLDHAIILEQNDPLLEVMQQHGMKVHVLEKPPTAEVLAEMVAYRSREIVLSMRGEGRPEISEIKVVCYETPKCSASFTVSV